MKFSKPYVGKDYTSVTVTVGKLKFQILEFHTEDVDTVSIVSDEDTPLLFHCVEQDNGLSYKPSVTIILSDEDKMSFYDRKHCK